MKETSKQFSWNQLDLLKTAAMIGISAGLTLLVESVSAMRFPTVSELEFAGKVTLLTAGTYLIKQFLTKGYKLTPTEGQDGLKAVPGPNDISRG